MVKMNAHLTLFVLNKLVQPPIAEHPLIVANQVGDDMTLVTEPISSSDI